MGKIRAVRMGDESQEKEQRRRAEARREGKKAKKAKVEGVGLKGGERTAVVEGTDIKPEFKKLIEKVEKGEAVEQPSSDKKDKKKKKAAARVRSKKYQEARKLVDRKKFYELNEAVELVKKTSLTKFDGSVELHLNLNPQTISSGKKEEAQQLRGNVSLPHGTGKTIRVAEASEKIIADIEEGKIEFDVLLSRPSMMPKLAKVARVLGPKGLMPNPKTGTVTDDIDKKKKELAGGLVNFKSEPENPIIHLSVGKVSFEDKKLIENIDAVISAVGRAKITKITIVATMGPGIKIKIN